MANRVGVIVFLCLIENISVEKNDIVQTESKRHKHAKCFHFSQLKISNLEKEVTLRLRLRRTGWPLWIEMNAAELATEQATHIINAMKSIRKHSLRPSFPMDIFNVSYFQNGEIAKVFEAKIGLFLFLGLFLITESSGDVLLCMISMMGVSTSLGWKIPNLSFKQGM